MGNTQGKTPHILIVDDEICSRESLRMILTPFYHVSTAQDGEEALSCIKGTRVDLVTLDVKLPGMGGIEVLKEVKKVRPEVEVVIITGYGRIKNAVDAIHAGAADYFIKPFNAVELLSRINAVLEKKKLLDRLREFLTQEKERHGRSVSKDEVTRGVEEVNRILSETSSSIESYRDLLPQWIHGHREEEGIDYGCFVTALVNAVERKDRDYRDHVTRVNFYSSRIADLLGLSPAEKEALYIGTVLHDIGELGIDDKILLHKGRGDQSGPDPMRRHPEIGIALLSPLKLPDQITAVIRHHHECYDGTGYPDRLKGNEIPLLARLVSVVDSFEAMVVGRPYGKDVSKRDAVSELQKGSGSLFDPEMVRLFSDILLREKEGPLFLNKVNTSVT